MLNYYHDSHKKPAPWLNYYIRQLQKQRGPFTWSQVNQTTQWQKRLRNRIRQKILNAKLRFYYRYISA